MAKTRPRKSLADYVAIAISPALIMVLIGSLVFFLQELAYSGEFGGRLKWVLFWFVFAAVLIARIGIEEGDRHAAVYTVAFWGAVALVVFKFLNDNPLVGFALLGVTWWCAKKLTWDCTLIDDSQDASGQGLLQITGFDAEESAPAKEENGKTDTKDAQPNPPGESETALGDASKTEAETQKPHAPGVWVVYFSLAALPLFGLGQVFLPADDAARRAAGFRYLWFYVAAGLGLLLTTSFLGLRRYLRQRKLTMPGRMTRSWIGVGAFLAAGILFVCLILPRPNAAYSFTKVVDVVSKKVGEASDYALGSDDAGEGEGRRAGREAKDEEAQKNGAGQKGNDGKQAGETSKSGQPASGGKGKKDGPSERKGGKQKQSGGDKSGSEKGQDGEKNRDKAKKDAQGGAGDPETENQNGSSEKTNSSQPGRVGSTIANLVKWLIYIAIAVAAVIFAIRHWPTIMAGLSRFWQDLKDLLAGLFGGKPNTASEVTAQDERRLKERPIRPFSDFANPFRTGMERDMGTMELIEYTYDALLAWGTEQGFPKSPDQTPSEYAAELSRHVPGISKDARQVANLYLQAAFSTSPPTSKSHKLLERAWNSLEGAGSLAS